MSEPRSIPLISNYDSSAAVVVIDAATRRELTRKVEELRWHRSGDNPGQAYLGTAKVLHVRQVGRDSWQGIVIVSTHYDV